MQPIKCSSWSTPWASKGSRVITRSIFARFLFAFGIVLGSLLFAGISVGVSAGVSGEESRPPPGTPPTAATRQEVWQAVVGELQREGLAEQWLPPDGDLDLPGPPPAPAWREVPLPSSRRAAVRARAPFPRHQRH